MIALQPNTPLKTNTAVLTERRLCFLMQLQELVRRNHFLIHISHYYPEVRNAILSNTSKRSIRGNLSILRRNLPGANGIKKWYSFNCSWISANPQIIFSVSKQKPSPIIISYRTSKKLHKITSLDAILFFYVQQKKKKNVKGI